MTFFCSAVMLPCHFFHRLLFVLFDCSWFYSGLDLIGYVQTDAIENQYEENKGRSPIVIHIVNSTVHIHNISPFDGDIISPSSMLLQLDRLPFSGLLVPDYFVYDIATSHF